LIFADAGFEVINAGYSMPCKIEPPAECRAAGWDDAAPSFILVDIVARKGMTQEQRQRVASQFDELRCPERDHHDSPWQAELNRVILERNTAIAEAARWFEAAMAVTADHNPATAPAFPARTLLPNLRRRLNRRKVSPIVFADRAYADKRWELAARYYRDALDVEPNEPRIWFQCAYALQAAGKISEAEVVFRKAFEHCGIQPSSGESHRLLPGKSSSSASAPK
jgi:tetratricopeptide (TPR) repeat protein